MRSIIVPLSSAVFIAACGGTEDDPSTLLAENTERIQVRDDVPAENRLNPIATLSLHNGNTLEFYEPAPGAVLISEVGWVPNPPVSVTYDLRSMSVVEIHQTFAPGAPVPAALTAAQHRLDGPVALEDVTVAETDVEPFANHDDVAMNHDANEDDGTLDDDAISYPKSAGGCPARWFHDNFCRRWPSKKECALSIARGRTTRGGLTYAEAAVCADIGKVSWSFAREDVKGREGSTLPISIRHGQYSFTYYNLRRGTFHFTFESNARGEGIGNRFHKYVGLVYRR